MIWKWTWVENALDIESNISDETEECISDSGALCSDSCNSSGSEDEAVPQPIIHSVVFKCMGCVKEHRYQEILAIASKRMKDGETVAVKLQEEPDNPFDSSAIAFVCMLEDKWERIGYVVKEVLDPVHDAIRNNHITEVRLYEWPKSVLRHCAKTFH